MATTDVKSRFCNQTDEVKKYGTGCWHPYRACKPRIKEQIVDLAMNNYGIRDTARALHISINAVIRALKNFLPVV